MIFKEAVIYTRYVTHTGGAIARVPPTPGGVPQPLPKTNKSQAQQGLQRIYCVTSWTDFGIIYTLEANARYSLERGTFR